MEVTASWTVALSDIRPLCVCGCVCASACGCVCVKGGVCVCVCAHMCASACECVHVCVCGGGVELVWMAASTELVKQT